MELRTGSFVGVLATSLTWALAWACPGVAIELIDNVVPGALPFAREIDMWPQTLGLPGLVGGVVFSVLVLISERGRGLGELSLPRSGAWGAVSGLIVGALIAWGVDSGLSVSRHLAAAVVGLATLLGAVSGVGSPLLLRSAGQRRGSTTS